MPRQLRAPLAALCRYAMALGLVLACAQSWAQGFDFDRLTQLARQRSLAPYADTVPALPTDLAALDYDGLRDIRWRPARALWRDAGLPFEAMFFHRGKY